jgi:hypothetical protein
VGAQDLSRDRPPAPFVYAAEVLMVVIVGAVLAAGFWLVGLHYWLLAGRAQ